ncbi:MAG: ATP synthase F0 subunit C [Acidobacteriales bacterium]|nr:ATP synthase F0 subunit C [Terriglobales bacterium]
MRLKLFMLLAVLLIAASPIYAADGQGGTNWVALTSGFSMAIASAGCGIAQSKAVASACEGMARNPGAAAAIRFALILGLVLIESLALYTLVIIILQVK